MLYLEDFVEMIEHLPQEVTDKLTTVRELDLQVQNSMDKLDTHIGSFFRNMVCMNEEDIYAEHDEILKEYSKNMEDSGEKMSIVQNMGEYLGKYIRRLEQDLLKFKVELESDNPGCTDIIDKRVDERGTPSTTFHHFQNAIRRISQHLSYENPLHEEHFKPDEEEENHMEHKYPQISLPSTSSTQSSVFSMDQMSPGGSAIAAAASQAIVATQQMQQGRRTASLKASFEAIHSAGVSTSALAKTMSQDVLMNRELVGAAHTAVAATQDRRKKRRRRKKNLTSSVESLSSPSVSASSSQVEILDEEPMEPDPNEPRYCICNEVAFGDMVACDNKYCPYEWYHYACVGMTDPPKGKWYCPQCVSTMKKRPYRKSHI